MVVQGIQCRIVVTVEGVSDNANCCIFIEVLYLVYRGDGEERSESTPDDAAKRRFRYAMKLLESWCLIPGTQEDGSVDATVLKAWFATAREKAKVARRLKGFDYALGEVFSCSPEEAGVWPCLAVCEVIDEVESNDLERGFFIGTLNSRGSTWKNIAEGGRQERDLAAKYRQRADQLQPRFVRVIKVLRDIVKSYEYEAEREDLEARGT